jgi:hypothetical protein
MLARNHSGIGELEIFDFLLPIRTEITEMIISNQNILGNRGYFEALVESSVAVTLEGAVSVKKVLNADTLKNLIATEYFIEYEGEVA